jgi:hypothetical protein
MGKDAISVCTPKLTALSILAETLTSIRGYPACEMVFDFSPKQNWEKVDILTKAEDKRGCYLGIVEK